MTNEVIAAINGGIIGAVLTVLVTILVAKRQRAQSYYSNLIRLIETHNWNMLKHDLDPGFTIRDSNNQVAVVCYQHLNILFFVWLNKAIVEKDGSFEGWKNWAETIVIGANNSGRGSYRNCYRQILNQGDLFPRSFIRWLETKLNFSPQRFPEVVGKSDK